MFLDQRPDHPDLVHLDRRDAGDPTPQLIADRGNADRRSDVRWRGAGDALRTGRRKWTNWGTCLNAVVSLVAALDYMRCRKGSSLEMGELWKVNIAMRYFEQLIELWKGEAR